MASRSLIALTLAATCLLAACQQDLKMSRTPGTLPSRDLRDCAASGGTIQPRGRAGTPTCVHAYSDAGKSCTGKRDCQGKCIADGSLGEIPKVGDTAIGRCQPDDRLFGCYAEIENGKAKGGICVD